MATSLCFGRSCESVSDGWQEFTDGKPTSPVFENINDLWKWQIENRRRIFEQDGDRPNT